MGLCWRSALLWGAHLGFLLFGGENGRAGDWLRFRGPNGSGVSADSQPLPTQWSAQQNLRWKVALPGPGSSSPIVVGDRVYVTCWSGYGLDRSDPGEQEKLKRHLLCLDRATGETVWAKEMSAVLPEDHYEGMFAEHGYASHTPISDGERIFVYAGKSGAMAYDLQGNQLWHAPIGTGSDPRGWGSASSPVLFRDLVIITASAESEAIVALDKKTGKEVWREQAEGLGSTWGTPILVGIDDQRTDLVVGVPYEIWGLNPDTGRLRWVCEAMETDSYCSSVVADGDVVYGIEGRGGGSIAVRAGGKGDVSQSHLVWSGSHTNRIGTPLVNNGRIYFVSRGIASCIDAKNGQTIFEQRLSGGRPPAPRPPGSGGGPGRARGGGGGRGGQDYASLVAGDQKLFYTTRNGDVYVLKLGDQFEQLAVNQLTDDVEDFSATPAISNGQLFIRSSKHLYCVTSD